MSPINDVEIGLLQLSASGLPLATIALLQRVQNAAAPLIFELGTREHVLASLLALAVVGGSSSSCAVSCTQSSAGSARAIAPTS